MNEFERLMTPPTEWEIAALASIGGDIPRRMAFQLDKIKSQLERAESHILTLEDALMSQVSDARLIERLKDMADHKLELCATISRLEQQIVNYEKQIFPKGKL